MKRRLKLVLRGLEEWEREIVRVKRKDRQKGNAAELALLNEMYEETSRKADELERRAERLEREEPAPPARKRKRPPTDEDLGLS
jgi:hypothetical protein